MPFQTSDVHCLINKNGRYVLTAPLVYQGRDDVFIVPTGAISDLASVPRCLTWLIPVAGAWDRAAILHDTFCDALNRGKPIVSAVDADGLFRRVCRELGVPLVRRWLAWTGVRWGALANPARRAGWWKTAPAVLGVTALALPVVGPALLLVLAVLAVDRVVEAVR